MKHIFFLYIQLGVVPASECSHLSDFHLHPVLWSDHNRCTNSFISNAKQKRQKENKAWSNQTKKRCFTIAIYCRLFLIRLRTLYRQVKVLSNMQLIEIRCIPQNSKSSFAYVTFIFTSNYETIHRHSDVLHIVHYLTGKREPLSVVQPNGQKSASSKTRDNNIRLPCGCTVARKINLI